MHRFHPVAFPLGSLFFALMACLPPGLDARPAEAGDWPQWRGPQQNGISEESGWAAKWSNGEGRILWKKELGRGYSSVSVKGGRLYTMGFANGGDTTYCLDAQSGKEIWHQTYPAELHARMHDGGPAGTPAVSDDGGQVFTLNKVAMLRCHDGKSGKLIWQRDLRRQYGASDPQWKFAGSPRLLGRLVIVDVGCTLAFDRSSGKLVWKTERDYGAAYSTPVVFERGGKWLIAVFPRFGLVILDARNGRELAKYSWTTRHGVNAATPVLSGERVFISSEYGTGCALLSLKNSKLQLLWRNKNMQNKMASSVIWKDHIYGFDGGRLRCLDLRTGESVWSERGLGMGSLMLADGKLIVLSERGELLIAPATASGFAPTARKQVLDAGRCWIVPVLAGGRIYCRSSGGQLVCVDVSRS